MVVAGERTARFLQHYAAAGDEAKAATRARIESLRPSGAGVHWSPPLEMLRELESVATGVAQSGVEGDAARLDPLAGALDLVASPGAFEAGVEGLRPPITVRVERLWDAALANAGVTLTWIDAAGERVHGRREPVDAGAFTERGFEMYLRAPPTASGACRLYGTLTPPTIGEHAAVVTEIRVDAIADLRARLDAIRGRRLDGHPGYDRLRELLTRLLVHGRRGSCALGGAEMLAALERWNESGPPTGLLVPLELVWTDAQSVDRWLWSYSPRREPRVALALLSPPNEAADAVFAGPHGAAWFKLAEDHGAHLFAANLPTKVASVGEWLGRLREWVGDCELVVIARGDVLSRLTAGVAALDEPPYDAWVASSSIAAHVAAGLLGSKPGLLLAPAPAPSDADHVEWICGADAWMLNDLVLCAHVGDWLARRAERR